MKITSAVIVGSMLVVSGSAVYAQGGAQASSSASSSTSAQASASSNNSGSSSAKAGHSSASLSSGTAMNAALSQPVDAKKNKPGDQVTAKTTGATKSEGKVVIRRAASLLGTLLNASSAARKKRIGAGHRVR